MTSDTTVVDRPDDYWVPSGTDPLARRPVAGPESGWPRRALCISPWKRSAFGVAARRTLGPG